MSDNDNWITALLFWAALAFAVWFGFWGRNSSIRYQYQYDAPAERVSIAKRPNDCEFMTAPLGRKNCDYEKQVDVYKFDRDPNAKRPVVSTDGGKSWSWNDGGPTSGTQVIVWWKKVDD